MSDDELPKKKKRRRGIKLMPLNLAPLIDINANLLFFLIIANSVQEDRLQAANEIELPASTSQAAEAGDLISLVVGKQHITVNEREVVLLSAGELDPKLLDKKRDSRIVPLYTYLQDRFKDLVAKGASPTATDDESKIPVVFLQVDKGVPYATLSKVMRTCGEAGFTRFRMAAKSGG
jgi:biopolymer transport protein ExbD